jgi:hypothetical protein
MSDFLARFAGVKKFGGSWTCRCPAHDDNKNSLSITHVDGKWLVNCFAGCTVEAITSAIGLEVSDLFDPEGGAHQIPPATDQLINQRA